MGITRGTKPVTGTISANSTTYVQVSEGPIMLCYGADNLRIVGFLRALSGSFRSKVRYRTFTARRENPDAWVDFGSAHTANGGFTETQSLAAVGVGKMWIQVGLSGSVSAGSGGDAESCYQAFNESKGRIVGQKSVDVAPDINSTKTGIYVFGPPIPALGLTGIQIAGSVSGLTGTLKLNFAMRELGVDLKAPAAWGSGLITEYTTSADGDYNTGTLTPAPSANAAFVQFGIMIPANDARCQLDLILAAKY